MIDTAPAEPRTTSLAGNRVLAVLLGSGVILLIVAFVMAFNTFRDANEDNRRVEHTLEAEATINRLGARNERIETGRRGYIIRSEPQFRMVIEDAQREFDRDLVRLRGLISDNSSQRIALQRLDRLDAERDVIIAALFADASAARRQVMIDDFAKDRGVIITSRMREIVSAMGAEEGRLLRLRNQERLASLVQLYWVAGIAIMLLIAILGAVIFLIARFNRELEVAQAKLRLANTGLEEAVAARTAELSRANEEIQRFAYIVSHDLRSPLVNVLGFTSELDEARKTLQRHLSKLYEAHPALRDEAVWLAVDEDLPEALGFIRTSTEKMDRLINSILELSRQGRRNLTPERLDMTSLAKGVAATMHQRAEAAGAEVTLSPLPELESDRIAVEQILANLVENALKYLSPGRSGVVSVEGRRNGRNIEVSVVDNGRGIAPADQERIFELFRRAGTQDQPGEGIGLANVRALAYRLGGRIAVESQLGEGSRFTLILPEKFPVELA